MLDADKGAYLLPRFYTREYQPEPIVSPDSLPTNLLDLIGYTASHPEILSAAGGTPLKEILPEKDIAQAELMVETNLQISNEEKNQYRGPRGNSLFLLLASLRASEITGLNIGEENTVSTIGGQHAITLLLESYFSPGNPNAKVLLTQEPTYAGLLDSARKVGIKYVVGIKTDKDGISIPDLRETLAALKRNKIDVGLVYTMLMGNPDPLLMSNQRSEELAQICETEGIPMTVDCAYDQILFDSNMEETHLPLLKRKGTSLIFSWSKKIAPARRVGAVVSLDHDLLGKVIAHKRDGIIFSPPVNELIIWQLQNNPDDPEWYQRRLNNVIQAFRNGSEAAFRAITRNSDVFKSEKARGSMFNYVGLPPGVSSVRLLPRLLTESKIAVVPGPWTQAGQLILPDGTTIGTPKADNYVRMCFASRPPVIIEEIYDKFADAVRDELKN